MSEKKYVKKGEPSNAEETKIESTNQKGGRDRRQRGKPNKPEADTKKNDKPEAGQNAERSDNRGARGGRGRQGNRPQRKEDKNSWAWKYHHQERPQHEKVKIDADTVIPALPAKEDRLKEPVKDKLDKQLAELDAQINKIRIDADALHKQRRSVLDGGKMQGANVTYKEALAAKIKELKAVNDKKRGLTNKMKAASEELDQLDVEKRALLKLMHKDFHSVAEVREGIKKLEFEQKTTSFNSSSQENQLIKQIDQLKASVPKAERFQEIKPRVHELAANKKKIWEELRDTRAIVTGHEGEIEKIRAQMEEVREGQTDIKEQADAITEDIKASNEKVSNLFTQKDSLREEYWHARYDYDIQKAEIHHIEWLARAKERFTDKDKQRQEILTEREQALKDLPHPYLKEIQNCETLISFCQVLLVRSGLEKKLNEAEEDKAKDIQQNLLADANREQLAKMVGNKQIETVVSKKEREEAQVTQFGSKGKRKGKKQKAVEVEDSFNIDIGVVRKFGSISISPPVAPEDLRQKIDDIKAKQEWYEANGGEKLQQQIEEIKKQIEQEDAEEEKTFEEEEEYRGGRGGRGGFRGGREGDSRRGRGRGGRATGQFRVKNEFEGEDDEEEQFVKHAQKPKKSTQKKTDLVIDEDNYPTL